MNIANEAAHCFANMGPIYLEMLKKHEMMTMALEESQREKVQLEEQI